MASQSPPPELIEVYHLLKTGQRNEAARRLKAYLPQHRYDADAWWLLAHAVPQVEYQRHCLEEVLRLRPQDARARAWLDRLTPAEDAPPAPPEAERVASAPATAPAPPTFAPAPVELLDEPDDVMILGMEVRHNTPIPPRPPTGPLPPLTRTAPPAAPRFAPRAPSSAAPQAAHQETPSFEEFAAHLEVDLPAPDDDPFWGPASAPFDAPNAAAVPSHDPFTNASLFDPAAHARLRPAPRAVQVGGTGNQPASGPGLAFVSDAAAAPAPVEDAPFQTDRQRERANVERMIGRALIAFAAVVLVGIVLLAASSQGWLKLGADRHVPAMVALDGGSFTMQYPKGYDMRCEHEVSGYPVCGIANHAFYNEVEYFVGKPVDLGELIAQSINLFGAANVPEEQFSVIVMDVPTTSPSYDNSSWAKTKFGWYQEFGGSTWFDEGAVVDYERQEITVDGHAAYFYRYASEGQWRDGAWDVYVPHDGITLWLRVVYTGERKYRLPSETVEAMIKSIDLKPVAEW